MYGLIDCNNFYASCERVFNPALRNRPIIVLSNNDGCVIARSNEAKALGIKMGVPYYQVKDIVKQHGVFTFSSNYTLYGDMSHRVMTLIRNAVPHIEIYSIDECFVGLSGVSNLPVFCQDITQKVSKGTGIPLSMGVASTKTLAKVASKFAKKYKAYHGVCIIDTEAKREKALQMTPIEDVGDRTTITQTNGILWSENTAYDFTLNQKVGYARSSALPDYALGKSYESCCIDFEAGNKKKSITTSRSFSKSITRFQELYEAVANFTDACARKLREQESKAGSLLVYIVTNSHREDLPQYHNSASIKLPVPSSDPSEMVKYASSFFKNIYRRVRL
jgi:DNA polymerase V